MTEVGRLLTVLPGFGIRIAFVDEDDIEDRPEIVVKEPDKSGL